MKEIKIAIHTEYIELNQLLKLAGFASSGGAGGVLVAQGLVKVDGVAESRKRNKIRAGQIVEIADARILVTT
jgi:ribosome-associated protein